VISLGSGRDMSRNVLLIAAAYYPSNAPGSHRPAKSAKYLVELGWKPSVLCADWPRVRYPQRFDPELALVDDVCPTARVSYTPRWSGRPARIAGRAATAVFPYDTPRGKLRAFLREAARVVESVPVDLVWSTYLPGYAHVVARAVSERTGVPWVADFRDLPDQEGNSWVSRRSVKYEIDVCSRASALTTTSGTLASRLEARHDVPVHVVMNGFDPDDYGSGVAQSRDRFAITHYGTLYGHRDPRPLFRALDLLQARGEMDLDRVTVEFHGPPARQVHGLAGGFECARIVRANDRIPYRTMLRRQQESTVLLLLKSAAAGGSIPSKLFEYLGAGRPVLNIPGDEGEVDGILSETRGGVSACARDEIASILGAWYGKWGSGRGVTWEGLPERVERYSRRRQTLRLVDVFESVLSRPS